MSGRSKFAVWRAEEDRKRSRRKKMRKKKKGINKRRRERGRGGGTWADTMWTMESRGRFVEEGEEKEEKKEG